MTDSTKSESTGDNGSGTAVVTDTIRNVAVEIELKGGHRHELVLREDAPELQDHRKRDPNRVAVVRRSAVLAVLVAVGRQGTSGRRDV